MELKSMYVYVCVCARVCAQCWLFKDAQYDVQYRLFNDLECSLFDDVQCWLSNGIQRRPLSGVQ